MLGNSLVIISDDVYLTKQSLRPKAEIKCQENKIFKIGTTSNSEALMHA